MNFGASFLAFYEMVFDIRTMACFLLIGGITLGAIINAWIIYESSGKRRWRKTFGFYKTA